MFAKTHLNALGLMSGTSMDGIDGAVIRTNGSEYIIEGETISIPYPKEFQILLKAAELTINRYNGNLNNAEQHFQDTLREYLSQELGVAATEFEHITLNDIFNQSLQLHYEAACALLSRAKMSAQEIDVVGYHGQTFYHNPSEKLTIQIGDGKALSHKLGLPVVNNFRSNDVLHGGQGAPFAPIYHQALAMRDRLLPCVVVNCGGIANLSIIHGANYEDIIGFDSGPGNGLLDRFIRQRTNGKEVCDRDGKYGINGTVHPEILSLLRAKSCMQRGVNYFDLSPPKSLDIRDFHLIPELQSLSIADGAATLAAFTAQTIVSSYELTGKPMIKDWIIAGGGWNNPVILQFLKQYLVQANPYTNLQHAAAIGWDGQALEAQLVAFLSVRRVLELPISFPGTTAVPFPLLGGDVHTPGTAASNCLV